MMPYVFFLFIWRCIFVGCKTGDALRLFLRFHAKYNKLLFIFNRWTYWGISTVLLFMKNTFLLNWYQWVIICFRIYEWWLLWWYMSIHYECESVSYLSNVCVIQALSLLKLFAAEICLHSGIFCLWFLLPAYWKTCHA